jgi:exosome complex RNA-binding protein Csl4
MRDASQNKAKTMRIIMAWCDKCRAQMKIVTPRDKEAKYCPCCRRKILTESIRYV